MLTAKQPFRPFPVGRGLALVSLALALYQSAKGRQYQ